MDETHSRREFLRKIGQGVTAVGLLSCSGYLLYHGTSDCQHQGVCARCGVYGGCTLDRKQPRS